MKKFLALFFTCVLLMSLSFTAFAADPTTGSITVKNATKGHTYTAYKVFDATYNGDAVSYTTTEANAAKLPTTLFGKSQPVGGKVNVWKLSTASDKDVTDWIAANYSEFGGTAINGVFDASNSTVTFSNLPFGYYYITSSLGATVTIDTAAPTAEVYDKNSVSPVNPVKTVVKIDGKDVNDVTANGHVGSVVEFKITAKTTNWTTTTSTVNDVVQVTPTTNPVNPQIRTEWSVTDNPSNMTADLSTIVVKFNGTAVAKDDAPVNNKPAPGKYIVTEGTNGSFTILVNMVDANGNSVFDAPKDDTTTTDVNESGLIPIEITYSATITKDAGKNPAKNEAGSTVEVFTYGFQVAKTDGTNPLAGAQFELYKVVTKDDPSTTDVDETVLSSALTFVNNGDGTYTYEPSTTATTVTTLDMTTNTTISVLGLDNSWTYVLKEITVPKGYNKADDKTIEGTSLTKITEGLNTSMTSTALYKETVINNKGQELPSTGGIGTTIFYVAGIMLVLGACVLFAARKRISVK